MLAVDVARQGVSEDYQFKAYYVLLARFHIPEAGLFLVNNRASWMISICVAHCFVEASLIF